jgi:hypothetical protein
VEVLPELLEDDDAREPNVFVEPGSAVAAAAARQDSGNIRVLPAGKTKITMVDTLGVYTIIVRFCRCPDAKTLESNYLKLNCSWHLSPGQRLCSHLHFWMVLSLTISSWNISDELLQ